jgi:hypothetical protein
MRPLEKSPSKPSEGMHDHGHWHHVDELEVVARSIALEMRVDGLGMLGLGLHQRWAEGALLAPSRRV